MPSSRLVWSVLRNAARVDDADKGGSGSRWYFALSILGAMAGSRDPKIDELEGDGAVATEVVRKVKPPQLYKVLLHNDDYTTMEFVVMVLMSVFRHSEPEAVQIMLNVHQKGSGVAGIYSREIAETKADKVTRLARENEYPLKCSVEPA